VIRYTKIFASTFFPAIVYNSVGGFKGVLKQDHFPLLDQHKMQTSENYVKRTFIFSDGWEMYQLNKKKSAMFAIFFTTFAYITDKFQSYDYSTSQSLLRACFLVSPFVVLYQFDRPITNFWYHVGIYTIFSCK
jgi:hypothetical protein